MGWVGRDLQGHLIPVALIMKERCLLLPFPLKAKAFLAASLL